MAKRTSEAISSLAGRLLKRPQDATPQEIKRLAACALSQDETARKLAAVHAALEIPTEGKAT